MTESERSVAVGSAAPDPPTNGHAGPRRPRWAVGRGGPLTAATVAESPPTAATVADATGATARRPDARRTSRHAVAADPAAAGGCSDAAPGAPPRGRRSAARWSWPPRRRRRSRSRSATGPARATRRRRCPRATSATSRRTSRRPTRPRTARRCGARSPPASSACSPPGSPAAARASSNEYERQFRSQDTRGYELEDLEASGGRVGRASGSYRVDREGRDAIEGRIVFGVVRDRGEPRIALIAVTPAG